MSERAVSVSLLVRLTRLDVTPHCCFATVVIVEFVLAVKQAPALQ